MAHGVCCSVLQYFQVCCSVLQCVAVCCSVLQCVAVCCSVLQCIAVHCSALQCIAVCCSVLHCACTYDAAVLWHAEKIQNFTLQYTATHCNTLQYTATHCNIRMVNKETGQLERTEGYQPRLANLNDKRHNFLRITRILKFLGEVGLERCFWRVAVSCNVFALCCSVLQCQFFWAQSVFAGVFCVLQCVAAMCCVV